jgi:hypothetical protein
MSQRKKEKQFGEELFGTFRSKTTTKKKLLKDELRRLGITKGLSKLTNPQLENLIKKAKEPHKVTTLQERRALLSTISKKDLLKVIRIIRITNYSHLKHDDLIDLISSKYWSDFHTRWFNQAPDGLLPYKPAKLLPKPSFSFPPEEKKGVVEQALKAMPSKPSFSEPKKKQQKPKKDEVKEEQKHNGNLNLEELGDIELTVWKNDKGSMLPDRPNIIHADDIEPEELEAYVRNLGKVLIKIKNGKLKTPNWEKETAIRLQEEAIKVLKDYIKAYKKEFLKQFPKLLKNLSLRDSLKKFADALKKDEVKEEQKKKTEPKKKPKKDEVKEEQKHDTKRKPETIYDRRKRQADKEAEELKKTERDEFYHYKNIKDGWFGPKSWGRTEKDKRCLNFLEKNQLDNNRKIQLVKDQEESGIIPPHSNKFWDKVDDCVTHLEERDIWPNPSMFRDNTEKDRYFRWTAKDFLEEGRYLDDEFECVKQLEKFGIDDDKTFKLWALKNHPDKVTGIKNKAKAGELFTKVRGCVELLKSRRQFPIKAGGKPTGGKPTVGKSTVGKPTVGKPTVGKPKLLKAPPKKPKKKPEEKKEDDIPTTFLKATKYIRNLDKSDKDLARRKIMLVLANFKGNQEFYEKNKGNIDSNTSSAFRKRMGFT